MIHRVLAALLTLALIVVSFPVRAATSLPGHWTVQRDGDDGRRVELELLYESANHRSQTSTDVTLAALGLTAQRLAEAPGPLDFRVTREAGTFACSGTAGAGFGSGSFDYLPSEAFGNTLAARGIGRPTSRQSIELALENMTLSVIDALQQAGSRQRVTVDGLVRLAQHGVDAPYIAGLAAQGYSKLSIDDLIPLRDHGVTVNFVRELRAAGYTNLTPDELTDLVDHGVRLSLMEARRTAGLPRASPGELVRLADHGVSPTFIAALAQRGYARLTSDQLVELADHGVTVSFIDRLRSHGYRDVSVDDLIRLRDSGL